MEVASQTNRPTWGYGYVRLAYTGRRQAILMRREGCMSAVTGNECYKQWQRREEQDKGKDGKSYQGPIGHKSETKEGK